MSARRLIVNADDLGMSAGVNRGIAEAHERGIVTSASLMVHRPAADEAARYARERAQMSVGLHIELGEWLYQHGEWRAERVVVDTEDAAAVRAEVAAQLEAFRRLVGRDPTHVDSHQHVHREGPVASVVATLGRELGVLVRHFSPVVRYCGEFYGQMREGSSLPELITADALAALVRRLPTGVTELACHPGYAEGLESSYRRERELELVALCDARVRQAVEDEGIVLSTFADVAPG